MEWRGKCDGILREVPAQDIPVPDTAEDCSLGTLAKYRKLLSHLSASTCGSIGVALPF